MQFGTIHLCIMADFKYLNILSASTAEGKGEVATQIEADFVVLVK